LDFTLKNLKKKPQTNRFDNCLLNGFFFSNFVALSENILTLGTKDKRTFAEKKRNKRAGHQICKLIMASSRLDCIYSIVKESSADLGFFQNWPSKCN
jgi:hypothetical protein